jgi:hypothetical protein
MKYSEYLHTDYWIKKRNKIRVRKKLCQICGSEKRVEVHHFIYRGYYKEKGRDTKLLCRRCHQLVHDCMDSGELVIETNNPTKRFIKARRFIRRKLGIRIPAMWKLRDIKTLRNKITRVF